MGNWTSDHANCLWNIAKRLLEEAGNQNPTVQQIWEKIHEIQKLNPETIKNPDLVYPYAETGIQYLVDKGAEAVAQVEQAGTQAQQVITHAQPSGAGFLQSVWMNVSNIVTDACENKVG